MNHQSIQPDSPAPTDRVLAAMALRKILARVAVSEPVALVIAGHAGLIREAR